MSISLVDLPPSESESESDDSSDAVSTPSAKSGPPRRVSNPDVVAGAENPFEVTEDESNVAISKEINFVALGLPPLSFESDPFLSPLTRIAFDVKRHRIWLKGMKGAKFSLTISGYTVLVAKRKMRFLQKTWYLSRSMNFSLDTPDLVGRLVRSRQNNSFILYGPRERKADGFKEILAGIDFEGDGEKTAFLGHNLWAPKDSVIVPEDGNTDESLIKLIPVSDQFPVPSVKNASFRLQSDSAPCFLAQKKADGTLHVTSSSPLCLTQAFGLAIALFAQ